MTGAVVGGVVAATRPPPPAYYHGGRYRQVVVVRDQPRGVPPCGPNERLIMVACPSNSRPGERLEIEVEGRPYAITIPNGVSPGQHFYVRVPRPQPQQQQQQQQQQQVYQATHAGGAAGGGGSGTVYQATVVSGDSTKAEPEFAPAVPTASVVQASAAEANSGAVLEAAVVSTASNDPPPAVPEQQQQQQLSAANPFMDEPTPPPPAPDAWVVTAPMKADFDAAFVAAGGQLGGGGRLQPAQVKDALLQSGLPRETLRSIWELSDMDKDGALDLDEWAVAKYLCGLALQGQSMPAALAPNMVPPAKRNPF